MRICVNLTGTNRPESGGFSALVRSVELKYVGVPASCASYKNPLVFGLNTRSVTMNIFSVFSLLEDLRFFFTV